jgi:hypothetical protein
VKRAGASEWRALAPSLVGAAGLAILGARLRVDRLGDDCSAWPPFAGGVACGAGFALSVALLAIGWRRVEALRLPLGRVLALAAPVHGVALLAPPFLSLDSLYYAAIGRAAGTFHADPARALSSTLPPDDALLALLPPGLKIGSAYGCGFNHFAALLARRAGSHLELMLRGFQWTSCAAAFGAAVLLAFAVEPERRGRAAALVLFCPLVIVEATANAHNDALLMLAVAAGACLLVRGRAAAALLALGLALAIKASALLAPAVIAGSLLHARLGARARAFVERRLLLVAAAAAVVGVALVAILRARLALSAELALLVGDPGAVVDHCTRSVECAPRVLLRFGLGAPRAAWLLGLGFRAGGALMLIAAARRSPPLAAAAAGLFFYYLYLHAYLQTWYLLSLVPLVAFADEKLRPAMRVMLGGAIFYYAVRIPLNCDTRPAVVAAKELAEALIVIVPPTVAWRRARQRG